MSRNIFTELKIPSNSIFNLDTIKDTKLPQRIIKSLQEVKPDNILIVNEKPIILFFKSNNEDEKKNIFKKCWNFSESPIVIIEGDSDFDVYNGFNFFTDSKELELLKKDGLNYISILNGEYFKYLIETKQNKKVDTYLLDNIKNAREILISLFQDTNKDLKYIKHISNSLIGRIIFIRYLIDRKIFLERYKKSLTNDDLKVILSDKSKTYELFGYLKSSDGFNGDWFPILEDEENIVQEKHLQVLEELISGSKLTFGSKNIQRSLFDIYDFSIIPIEFISNVYESFIGEDEQKKSGAYYTPTFLVDYILKYTVDEYFKNNLDTYNCKVLDPACGSGIFLVETLRKLVSQFEKVKQKTISSKELKKLVQDNIFGIDKDENAISISVFSLYLAMLDYQNPKELEKFKFPYLLRGEKNSTPNFFNNDSFETNELNEVLKRKGFDFIIGNPPYGRGTVNKSKYALDYIEDENIKIGNQDIVQPFMVRVKDFISESTKISFIVTSKVLYNLQSKDFRTEHFFNNFKVNHILELSSVRKEIFENADVPVSIIFYELGEKKSVLNNVIKYVSVKPNPYFKKLKTLTISKSDFKKIKQSKLIDDDFLWKILVYGSYLDFNFIKRVKNQFKSIDDVIDSKPQGLIINGGDKNPTVDYIGMPYVQTKQFSPFYIEKNNIKWEREFVHRNKSMDLFKAPSLLVSKGIGSSLELKAGILHEDSIFTDSITSVKCKREDMFYCIMAGLYSSFFKYFILNTGSSIGIEREQIHNPEKFSLPYIESDEIIKYSKEIEELVKNDFLGNDTKFNNLKNKLDTSILEALDLNEQEYSLIAYMNDIVKPWVIQKNYKIPYKKIGFEDNILKEYVNIFIKHYSNIYNQNNMYFQANILWDDYVIGIYFKVLYKKPEAEVTWKKEKNIKKFIEFSTTQTLENLFIQKDIKGFEKDGFYVVKPNEYKNWHKAIGYLDFYEFRDAILRAGKVGK